eukprot:scaffold3968_cov359-Prasinococcus_capsulatus_cf.AAC.9
MAAAVTGGVAAASRGVASRRSGRGSWREGGEARAGPAPLPSPFLPPFLAPLRRGLWTKPAGAARSHVPLVCMCAARAVGGHLRRVCSPPVPRRAQLWDERAGHAARSTGGSKERLGPLVNDDDPPVPRERAPAVPPGVLGAVGALGAHRRHPHTQHQRRCGEYRPLARGGVAAATPGEADQRHQGGD